MTADRDDPHSRIYTEWAYASPRSGHKPQPRDLSSPLYEPQRCDRCGLTRHQARGVKCVVGGIRANQHYFGPRKLTEYEKQQQRYGVMEGREYTPAELVALRRRIWSKVRVEVCDAGVVPVVQAARGRAHETLDRACLSAPDSVANPARLPDEQSHDQAGRRPRRQEDSLELDEEALNRDAAAWTERLAEERDQQADEQMGRSLR